MQRTFLKCAIYLVVIGSWDGLYGQVPSTCQDPLSSKLAAVLLSRKYAPESIRHTCEAFHTLEDNSHMRSISKADRDFLLQKAVESFSSADAKTLDWHAPVDRYAPVDAIFDVVEREKKQTHRALAAVETLFFIVSWNRTAIYDPHTLFVPHLTTLEMLGIKKIDVEKAEKRSEGRRLEAYEEEYPLIEAAVGRLNFLLMHIDWEHWGVDRKRDQDWADSIYGRLIDIRGKEYQLNPRIGRALEGVYCRGCDSRDP